MPTTQQFASLSIFGIILGFGLFFLSPYFAHAAGRVFYDGFESGNTNLWNQDSTRPRCTVVTSSADGIAGPAAGSNMVRCNDPGAAWQTLNLPSFNMSSEVLYRYRVRVDQNHDSTGGSTHKLSRIFHWTGDEGTYNDIFSMVAAVGVTGLRNDVIMNGVRTNNDFMYWGDTPGDYTADPSSWHTIEYYINKSTGVVKVWHDDIVVQNWDYPAAIGGAVGETGEYYIVSNWEDSHDGVNYVYFDNYEVYTDVGSGGSGLMSAGTITQGGGDTTALDAPTGLGVQ